jgi:hypothetical protein
VSIPGLTRDDNETIGFVVACAFSSAISMDELRQWCSDIVIRNSRIEDIPAYIFELVDFDQALMRIHEVIGFVPDRDWAEEEGYALCGIAAYRHRLAADAGLSADQAKQFLVERPYVMEKFRATFPFIALSV